MQGDSNTQQHEKVVADDQDQSQGVQRGKERGVEVTTEDKRGRVEQD